MRPQGEYFMYKSSIHWFRRDLRLTDNRALYEACKNSKYAVPVFVFDANILNKLKNKNDRRVTYIYETLIELKKEISALGSTLIILYGDPIIEIPKLAKKLNIDCVFTNKDYEPYARIRDNTVEQELKKNNIQFIKYKDQVIFEEKEILNITSAPYKVFTPYKFAWLKNCKEESFTNYQAELKNLIPAEKLNYQINDLFLEDIGFQKSPLILTPGRKSALQTLQNFSKDIEDYDTNRNHIDLQKTSKISIHLRFGTVSIRELFRFANQFHSKGVDVWKSELIWRDFYHMILSEFPYVAESPFQKQYNTLVWQGTEEYFEKWCEGQTGFPIIDAAMRYFKETGWMHNRLRMVVASFLTKDLLIDYRKGEKYFAQNLLDFDLAANNGGWQWCASTGCDAQPYFRVFNPETQSKNFDPNGSFIKKYCPELSRFSDKYVHAPSKAPIADQQKANCIIGKNYPLPVVHHDKQRLKAIEMFNAKKKAN